MSLVKLKDKESGEIKFFSTLWAAQKFCRKPENTNKYIIS